MASSSDSLKLSVFCSLCNVKILKSEAIQHLEQDCMKRLESCPSCHIRVSFDTLNSHLQSQCCERLVSCLLCSRELSLNNLNQHIRENCSDRNYSCEIGSDIIPSNSLAFHGQNNCKIVPSAAYPQPVNSAGGHSISTPIPNIFQKMDSDFLPTEPIHYVYSSDDSPETQLRSNTRLEDDYKRLLAEAEMQQMNVDVGNNVSISSVMARIITSAHHGIEHKNGSAVDKKEVSAVKVAHTKHTSVAATDNHTDSNALVAGSSQTSKDNSSASHSPLSRNNSATITDNVLTTVPSLTKKQSTPLGKTSSFSKKAKLAPADTPINMVGLLDGSDIDTDTEVDTVGKKRGRGRPFGQPKRSSPVKSAPPTALKPPVSSPPARRSSKAFEDVDSADKRRSSRLHPLDNPSTSDKKGKGAKRPIASDSEEGSEEGSGSEEEWTEEEIKAFRKLLLAEQKNPTGPIGRRADKTRSINYSVLAKAMNKQYLSCLHKGKAMLGDNKVVTVKNKLFEILESPHSSDVSSNKRTTSAGRASKSTPMTVSTPTKRKASISESDTDAHIPASPTAVKYRKGPFTDDEDMIITQLYMEARRGDTGIWATIAQVLDRKESTVTDRWAKTLSKRSLVSMR